MSFFLLDYLCNACGRTVDSLEPRNSPARTILCTCGGHAVRCLSPVRYKTVWGAAANTGKSDPTPAFVPDTAVLADRKVKFSEWKNYRRRLRQA
jgi:hypothetical protein